MKTPYTVVLTTPSWRLNGVNSFCCDLYRALKKQNIHVKLLVTRPPSYHPYLTPLPQDIPIEYLKSDSKKRLQIELTQYLEQFKSCIYFPNHDFDLSSISSKLSSKNRVVGIAHSDDPEHYAHFQALGASADAWVGVSSFIFENLKKRKILPLSKIHKIFYGINTSHEMRSSPEVFPIRLLYAGRFSDYQKNVLILPKIARYLEKEGMPFHMTLIGSGPDKQGLRIRLSSFIRQRKVSIRPALSRENLIKEYQKHSFFLLPSDFEGLSIGLLEAMGQGCVPIVSSCIQSGTKDVITPGKNGFTCDFSKEEFLSIMITLQNHPGFLKKISLNAQTTIQEKFNSEKMAEKYLALFDQILSHPKSSCSSKRMRFSSRVSISKIPHLIKMLSVKAGVKKIKHEPRNRKPPAIL